MDEWIPIAAMAISVFCYSFIAGGEWTKRMFRDFTSPEAMLHQVIGAHIVDQTQRLRTTTKFTPDCWITQQSIVVVQGKEYQIAINRLEDVQ